MSKYISEEYENKVENLLKDIGYFDLEVHSNPHKEYENTVYTYVGYIDDYMIINIYINDDYVEVMDCYVDEESYTQSKKLSLGEFLEKY